MASQDPVAFDAAASRIAGENPKRVKCITLAEKECLGNVLFKKVGLDPIIFQKEYPKKKKSEKLITLAYNLALKVRVLPNN